MTRLILIAMLWATPSYGMFTDDIMWTDQGFRRSEDCVYPRSGHQYPARPFLDCTAGDIPYSSKVTDTPGTVETEDTTTPGEDVPTSVVPAYSAIQTNLQTTTSSVGSPRIYTPPPTWKPTFTPGSTIVVSTPEIPPIAPVPLPASALMLLAALGWMKWRVT